MNLIEMIHQFDAVPNAFEYPDGSKFELSIRRSKGHKYIAAVWQVINGAEERRIWFATGPTPEQAKTALKKKILKDTSIQ